MLETYVLTLLAIWLTITIIGQLTGGYMGYSFLKNFQEKMGKQMILFALLLWFIMANVSVVIMLHVSFWTGLLLTIISGIQVLKYIDMSKQSKSY